MLVVIPIVYIPEAIRTLVCSCSIPWFVHTLMCGGCAIQTPRAATLCGRWVAPTGCALHVRCLALPPHSQHGCCCAWWSCFCVS